MSSSRIIKSVHDQNQVAEFSFRQIGSLGGGEGGVPPGGFEPMPLFDTSEIAGFASAAKALPQEQEEPPGVTMSEEELDRRLRESFNSGLQEGKNLAERGLVNVFRSLRSATEDVLALREKVLKDAEDDLLQLVVMIARKVILREITEDRSILVEVVRSATASLSDREEIIVHLNPDDLALVESGRDESLKRELSGPNMRLKADATVPTGNCQIDTEMGTIDARVEAQLEEIYRRMLEEKSQSPAAS